MRRVLAPSAAVLVSLAACVTQGTFDKKAEEANKLRQSWQEETAQRTALQQKLAAAQAENAALQAKNVSKESELRASRGRIVELQALVDELSKSKKNLEVAKAELEKKSSEYEQLASALRGEIDAGRVELMELRGRTTVKMKDKILFASGSATIGADGRVALRKLADALKGVQGKSIRVEGHTDNVPTNASGPFPTNWELSTARALAVVRFLQDAGVDATRLSGAGFGEFQPVAPNDTPEGKSLNRRIEIVLVPIEGAVPTPAAPAPAGKPATKT